MTLGYIIWLEVRRTNDVKLNVPFMYIDTMILATTHDRVYYHAV